MKDSKKISDSLPDSFPLNKQNLWKLAKAIKQALLN